MGEITYSELHEKLLQEHNGSEIVKLLTEKNWKLKVARALKLIETGTTDQHINIPDWGRFIEYCQDQLRKENGESSFTINFAWPIQHLVKCYTTITEGRISVLSVVLKGILYSSTVLTMWVCYFAYSTILEDLNPDGHYSKMPTLFGFWSSLLCDICVWTLSIGSLFAMNFVVQYFVAHILVASGDSPPSILSQKEQAEYEHEQRKQQWRLQHAVMHTDTHAKPRGVEGMFNEDARLLPAMRATSNSSSVTETLKGQ